ncbi:Sse1p [Paramicrosporidium saccamoebae]|uniref:Sse1p n=1 Tax=Paramicrosporidium saccamoebae TaxID=1246581 RepID=A0A2H9THX4_9FUNG|nr:Sse1p [Paramicrosporidium saccamoebae]
MVWLALLLITRSVEVFSSLSQGTSLVSGSKIQEAIQRIILDASGGTEDTPLQATGGVYANHSLRRVSIDVLNVSMGLADNGVNGSLQQISALTGGMYLQSASTNQLLHVLSVSCEYDSLVPRTPTSGQLVFVMVLLLMRALYAPYVYLPYLCHINRIENIKRYGPIRPFVVSVHLGRHSSTRLMVYRSAMLSDLVPLNWAPCRFWAFLAMAAFFSLAYAGMPRAPQGSTVMGIDFGSQYIKISFVAPGGDDPLPIMLNDMSERKTVNAVAFRNGQPYIGPHALKPILNQPERGFVWLNDMLGRRFEDATVQSHIGLTVADFLEDAETGYVAAKTAADEVAPVEYLSAMLISKLVQHTEMDSKKLIREAVITVPPYFGQAQRQAIIDSATIAGLQVLSLTNDLSAAALYYGTFSASKTPEPRHAIIIDSGATHTSAALVYIQPNHSEDGKNATLVEVKRTVSDLKLNGLTLDRAVAKILQAKFSEAHAGMGVPLGKAYNRLIAESAKVKHILSVNTEISVTIEELVGENHLSTRISRSEMESECLSLRTRASELVEALLAESKMDIENIMTIIPIGGNSRVPFIQDDLKKKFGSKVQFSLNMDETTAKGAAWYAASLARFKVKPTRFRDSYPFEVSLSYQNSTASSNPSEVNKISIYPAHSLVDGHKGIAFKNMDSINCNVTSDQQGDLFEASIEGLNAAVESFKDHDITASKLKFWVDLSTSGIVQLKDQPVALIEYKVQQPKPPVVAPAAANDTAPAEEPAEVEMETVQKSEQIPLKFSVRPLTHHLSSQEIEKWAQRILDMKNAEMILVRRSAARNELEANMYRLKDLLSQESFILASREEERSQINDNIIKSNDILEDDEKNHKTEDYETMLATLVEPEAAIERRSSENSRRPSVISKLKQLFSKVENYISKLRIDFPDPTSRAQTDEDLSSLEEKYQGGRKWLEDMEGRQNQLEPNMDPVVLCSSLEDRHTELLRLYTAVSSKKLPPPPVTTTSAEEQKLETPTGEDVPKSTETPEPTTKKDENMEL